MRSLCENDENVWIVRVPQDGRTHLDHLGWPQVLPQARVLLLLKGKVGAGGGQNGKDLVIDSVEEEDLPAHVREQNVGSRGIGNDACDRILRAVQLSWAVQIVVHDG